MSACFGPNLKVKRYKHVHLTQSPAHPPRPYIWAPKLMLRDLETQIAVIKIISMRIKVAEKKNTVNKKENQMEIFASDHKDVK